MIVKDPRSFAAIDGSMGLPRGVNVREDTRYLGGVR